MHQISLTLGIENLANKAYVSGRDIRGGVYMGEPRRASLVLVLCTD